MIYCTNHHHSHHVCNHLIEKSTRLAKPMALLGEEDVGSLNLPMEGIYICINLTNAL